MIYYFCVQKHINELQLEHTDGAITEEPTGWSTCHIAMCWLQSWEVS